ncbi:hypothetical protein [Tenacibaculum amylolyticum]|uniref:hypothetical protein n=1 Tax=Tenacibaculum amylolyticum TaxID=104269 RepID=UPI0038948E69
MLKDLLKLNGVSVLSKAELLNTKASLGPSLAPEEINCIIWVTGAFGDVSVFSNFYPAGSNASSLANSECLSHLGAGASRCQYDCSHDGFGQ